VAEPGSGRLRDLLRYMLRLGTTGFGGPIALVGYMQRDLVERRGWLTEREFAEGLAFSQLAPGPLAAQLAMYLGWLRAGAAGATICGIGFVLPSFVMVLALGFAYVRYGGLAWMQSAFYGVGAAVIAVILRSAFKLVRITVKRDVLLWVVFAVNAAVVSAVQREVIWVVVLSGLAVMLLRGPRLAQALGGSATIWAPVWAPLIVPAGGNAAVAPLFWFFAKAGAVVFGSGLAILPFLYGGVVEQYHWLTERQFLDAVAVSLITPGPVVITVAFIGYIVAGVLGGTLAAAGTFLPVYLSVVLLAPAFARHSDRPRVRAFVDGVTAAATGALAGAVVVLGRRAITDVVTALIAIATVALIGRSKKVPDVLLILAAAIVGVLVAPSAGPR